MKYMETFDCGGLWTTAQLVCSKSSSDSSWHSLLLICASVGQNSSVCTHFNMLMSVTGKRNNTHSSQR